MPAKFTQQEFENIFNEKYGDNFRVVGEYTGIENYIELQCKKCGTKFKRLAHNLRRGEPICPSCGHRNGGVVFIVGVTDMWTTNPDQAKLLLNPEDGYKYTQCSGQYVDWRCPHCGYIKRAKIAEVNKRGLSCPICSDGISVPNRFMASLLTHLNADFDPEYHFEGSLLRYDFYLPAFNAIVEMHGRQHYEEWGFNSRQSLKEEQENDRRKEVFAKENNISDYIVINCRNQYYPAMIREVQKSNLAMYLPLDNVAWDTVVKDAMVSKMAKAIELYKSGFTNLEIADLLKVTKGTSNNWLKQADAIGLCTYVKSEGSRFPPRKVVLTNTGEVFDSISDASRCYNISRSNIQSNCAGERSFCGLYNDLPAIWKYYEDYDPNEVFNYEFIKINGGRGIAVSKYDLDFHYIESYPTIKHALKSLGLSGGHSEPFSKALNSYERSAYGFHWFETSNKDQPDKTKIMTAS